MFAAGRKTVVLSTVILIVLDLSVTLSGEDVDDNSGEESVIASDRFCPRTEVQTQDTDCWLCPVNHRAQCPYGWKQLTPRSGKKDCEYTFRFGSFSMKLPGCHHTCSKTVTVRDCCAGHWGFDCNGEIQTDNQS